jgi:hypothetical protein
MGKYTKYKLYQKYETRGSQEAIPCYPNVFSIDGDGTMPLVIVEENSRDCGYTGETQPIYRWYTLPIDTYYYCDACQDAQYKWVNLPISQDWECVGTTKYYKQKKQVSVDGGSTWTDVEPPQYQRGALYEQNSSSCGYRTRTTTGSPYCEGYDKYVDVYSQYSTDGGNTWQTTATTPTMVEHNSEYCGYIEPQYRTTSGDTYCSGYNKYVPVYSQVSYDGGITWETTATTNVLLEQYSSDCGYVPLTRWVESGWTCVGYDKYVNNVQQISYDDGQTWQNTSNTSASTLIESYSTDCGVMYRWTDSDVTVCNEANKYYLAYKEMSLDNGQTWQEVVPRETSLGTLIEATSMDCFKFYATYRDPKTRYKDCDGSSALTRSDTFQDGYVENRMTTAIIGNCITSIGASAFTEFSSLTTVNISNNVTSIGNYAFEGCSNLTNLTLPSNLSTIGNGAFAYCTKLTNVTLGTGVTSIGNDAFLGHSSSLLEITCLATTPPTLGSDAFWNSYNYSIYVPCDSILAYKTASGWSDYANAIYPIPNTCTTQYRWIADCWECQGYDKWNKIKQQVSTDGGETWTDTGVVSATTLEESNSFNCGYGAPNPTSHYYYAEYSDGTRYAYDTDCDRVLTSAEANPKCYDSTKMTYAYVGGCYNEIGMGAFYEDTSLSSVTIDSIRYIGNSAFYGCSSLTSVTINAYSISWDAFKNCTSLQYIAIKTSTPPTLNSFGGVFVNTNNCPIYVPSGSVETYKSASGWTGYADRIQAPPSVTVYRWVESGWTCVGYDKYVNNIQQVSYDSGFTWENTSNTSASTLIETNSQDCGYLPSNVKYYFVASNSIYSGACDSDTTLASGRTSSYSGVTLQAFVGECVTSIGQGCFRKFTSLTKVSMPNSITSIGNDAFSSCSGLTSIDIPSGVTSIGNYAFQACRSLTSIVIPSGVTSIGNSTFSTCSGLTSIDIPSGVTTIGEYAFYGCRSLTSIDIPSGVTSIGTSAFSRCDSVTSINIPSGITSISSSVFGDCTSLTSVTIPDSVTSIGGQAFYNCRSLTSIDIPSGVTSIGYSAFFYCTSLTSVTIPDSVTSIGNSAFNWCSGLTSIRVNSSTPPTLSSSVFNNTNNCPIYVPAASVETYKSASGWSSYASRIQAIP